MIPVIIIATAVSTFLGGVFTLRFRDKLHLILGFSAGAVIGVAFFDLLPEALTLSSGKWETGFITSIAALGFIIYMILDRTIALHANQDEDNHQRGKLGAASLSTHSFLDGLAIGLAFKVSVAIGLFVAVAVLVHDFSDGINTVSMILKQGGSKGSALRWLALDALSPAAGVLSTLFFSLSRESLSIVLALFCGFFLYIGAADLLPESHHHHPTQWTTVMTVLGMTVLYIAIRIFS